jgi:hypothetical protein
MCGNCNDNSDSANEEKLPDWLRNCQRFSNALDAIHYFLSPSVAVPPPLPSTYLSGPFRNPLHNILSPLREETEFHTQKASNICFLSRPYKYLPQGKTVEERTYESDGSYTGRPLRSLYSLTQPHPASEGKLRTRRQQDDGSSPRASPPPPKSTKSHF